MSKTTEERVNELVAEAAGISVSAIGDINPSDRLDEMGLDSLDHLELIMDVEAEFGIDIDDEDAEQAETVQQLVDLVERVTAQ